MTGFSDSRIGNNAPQPIVFFEHKDGQQILKESLVTVEAERWAISFINEKPKLTMNQLRKFYGEVLTIDEKLKSGISFDVLKPQIKMIKSKVAYAYANGSNAKIPRSFKLFLDQMINSINTKDDFTAFKIIFETVVGYSVGKGVK